MSKTMNNGKSNSTQIIAKSADMKKSVAGEPKASPLSVTLARLGAHFDEERTRFAKFAAQQAEPVYRDVAADLYRHWWRWNVTYFRGHLKEPHLTIGRTGPRALGFCKPLTDFGAVLQITFNERVVFGDHKMVRNAWPAEGLKRFIRDILLHELIHQWQFESAGDAERSYHGHGRLFCQQCNRIGEDLGLAEVVVRRRGRKHADRPLCSQWPHCVRPPGFYLGDVEEPEQQSSNRERRIHYPDYFILLEAILGYIQAGRVAQLEALLEDELDLIRERRRLGAFKFRSIFT